eukprot:TRINITY_DN7765_c0_g1_i1.p1 TRINITY_DN7765_c0_g1~~TRINITY_DN7765_c0_g1_i1.p1  ORF type:complete len:257 (-),score=48.07 TRINITY_DN7765_c0_g1_i1:32-802(-)
MQQALRQLTNKSFKIRKSLTDLLEVPTLTRKQLCEANQLATEQIREMADEVERLAEKVSAMSRGSEKEAYENELQLHSSEVQNLKVLLRSTNIKCAINREKQHLRERETLFAEREAHKINLNPTDEALLKESAATNNTLQRLRQSMTELLEQGTSVNDRIEQSSTFIQQALNEHGHIEQELQTAKHLMTSFKIKNMTDKLLLVIAMVFYVLVCVYVLLARLPTPIASVFGLFSYIFSSAETSSVVDGVCNNQILSQ